MANTELSCHIIVAARSEIGVNQLPDDIPVEIEFTFELEEGV